MTYLEAAYKVLSEAHQPLHYSEITRRALEQHLFQPTGLTPDATMGARLYTDSQQEESRFVRVGKGRFDLAKQRRGGIEEQVQQINRRTREQLHALLLSMPAKRFESLIMELLLKMGFDESTLQVTPYSGDGGIDVVGVYKAAGLTEVNAAVQAKRWKGNVGAPTVTQLRGSLQVHEQGIVITTGGFSTGARKEAIAPGKARIALIDGQELVELLIKNRVGAFEKRLLVDALDEEWWGELLNTPVPVAPPQTSPPAVMEIELPAPLEEPAQLPFAENGASPLPTGRKPVAVTLLNQREPVKSWAALLVIVCKRLAEQHRDAFTSVATATHGRKRRYIAESGEDMVAPKPIPGTSLNVETNLSANDILRLTHTLLGELGYSADAMIVDFAA